LKKNSQLKLLESLKKIAPGTTLREGIENIVRAKMGSIVIIANIKEIKKICSGGFEINCDVTPAKLYELAKMDGAIILNQDGTKIIYANTHLFPDPDTPTSETGIMHRTANKVAKQIEGMVIAISKNREIVTLYLDDLKHNLRDMELILGKANRTLKTLEKSREAFNLQLGKLNLLELEGVVTLYDVVSTWQKAEISKMVASEIERYLYELGTEGRLIQVQLSQIINKINDKVFYLVKDYSLDKNKVKDVIEKVSNLSHEKLVSLTKLAEILGFSSPSIYLDKIVYPLGYRVLSTIIKLSENVMDNIIKKYKNLKFIKKLSINKLSEVEGIGKVKARVIINGLEKISKQK